MPARDATPVSPAERQVRALFFAYFGFVGTHAPYLSLYFAGAGYTVAQIGLLMAVPQALRIIAPPFWGLLADRSKHPGAVLVLSAVLMVLALGILPWASAAGIGASTALLASLFFASAGITPIAEAAALAIAAGDAGRYGAMRVWGSIGFVIAVVLIGPALDALGVASLPWFLIALGFGVVAAGLRMQRPAIPARVSRAAPIRERLRQRPVQAFFASGFLMLFAHAALYVLFSLYLARQGYSKSEIGAFWAISVLAEIILFRYQSGLFARFDSAALLAASVAVAALRFTLVGLCGGSWAWLVLAQLLHAVTFGLHHSASMALLHRWFEPAQQARAQALYVTIAYGCGGTLGGLVMSALWAKISPEAAFLAAGLVAGLGWLAARRCRVDTEAEWQVQGGSR